MSDYISKGDMAALIDRTSIEMMKPVFDGQAGNEVVAAAHFNEGIRSLNLAILAKLKEGEKDEA